MRCPPRVHQDAPRSSDYQSVYVWLDIFAIWQTAVFNDPEVEREKRGDLEGLQNVINTCRTTVLMWHTW